MLVSGCTCLYAGANGCRLAYITDLKLIRSINNFYSSPLNLSKYEQKTNFKEWFSWGV